MSQPTIPAAGIRTAFERAALAHRAVAESAPHPAQDTQASTTPAIGAVRPATGVERAISNAARQTSIDFDFLVAQAQVESAMDPNARARTSSATGLYQFIDSTWLNTMKRHGERFGLGDIAAQISVSSSGAAYVAEPVKRSAILDLRNDPQIASLMAAGLAEDNRAHLTPILGRQPDHSELYLAHFLGAGGAGRFLSAMAQDPSQPAAALFRKPAAANRPVFYEPGGSPRSLAGVMEFLSGKLERARANAGASGQGSSVAALDGPVGMIMPGPGSHDTSWQRTGSDPNSSLGRTPPLITARPASALNLAPVSSRPPMSSLLESALSSADTGLSDRSTRQIRRAYEQLKAFGL